MQPYEYRIIKFDGKGMLGGILDLPDVESEFNQMGESGWELVPMLDTNDAYGSTKWVVATFKRAKMTEN
ncbi:DUF4177 domain-containing protein [Verrucomicrobiales bacterium]|nr:DUF4177 domain-containing protein [Verrucomicrobiales bacterium]MDC0322589.1 DUF4177 domain-containing protein [Verrucomicrobiales bacterium]